MLTKRCFSTLIWWNRNQPSSQCSHGQVVEIADTKGVKAQFVKVDYIKEDLILQDRVIIDGGNSGGGGFSSVGSGNSGNNSSVTYNYDGSITLRFNRPGDYDVTFKTSSVTKTIHYSVDYEAPLTIEGTVHNGEKDSSFSPESSFAMYKSNKIYIGANIGDNNGGNGDAFEPGFTAVVDKTTAKLEKTTLNLNAKDVE